jgi:asparagine synthase (glutamine-hydrolysing)
MCGIFGFVGYLEEQAAKRCVDALAHRGPDAQGLWRGDGITLGHRRLSILDLSERGGQPMSFPDGRYWITFNGEIYNFLELRSELEGKGYVFRSDSDTEIILAAYREWGEECQTKFNGMWAFGIWDDKERTLFLSRDRFGKKPLFYSFLPKGFAFASEMKAILPLMRDVSYNISLVRGSAKRIMSYESTSECLIKDIRRFPAGHCGLLKEGRLVVRRWWCTLDHLIEVPERYEGQVEMMRDLFLDACRLRMRSDVPIGTALSGGLDSSSVISSMACIEKQTSSPRVNADWQHAFVACFPGTPLDESSYAKKVSEHLGIKPMLLNVDPLQVIDRLYDHLFLCEELFITSPIPFMVTYGAMKDHHIKATIDGHGADELFGGYYFDYIHALGDAGMDVPKVLAILDTLYEDYPKGSTQFKLPSKPAYFLKWHLAQVVKKILQSPKAGRDDSHPNWIRLDNLNKVLYLSTHETVLPTLLRNYDRYSMANGVEIRMPFMDYRIVCFAFSIPWTSKMRKGYSKAIIRDAVAPFMPHEIAYRKNKIGFNSPIVDWMRGPLKTFFLDVVHSQSFENCPLIDPKAVLGKIKGVIENRSPSYSSGEEAWTSIVPYFWDQAMTRGRQGVSYLDDHSPLSR